MNRKELIEGYEEHIELNDREALEIVLATYVANYMAGVPLWLMLIGASGGSKSTGIEMFYEHESSHPMGGLTGKTGFSGYTGKTKKNDLGEKLKGKVGCFSDLAELLTMSKDARNEIMSMFRQMYDGDYRKEWGSNKPPVEWKGKFGLIGATVPAVDAQLSRVMELGERFIRVVLKSTREQNKRATKRARLNVGKEVGIKEDLYELGKAFLNEYIPKAKEYTHGSQEPFWWGDQIDDVVTITAYLRTYVSRGAQGQLEYEPIPEVPTRLVKQMTMLANANCLLDERKELDQSDMDIILRVCMDSVPMRRGRIFSALLNGRERVVQISEFTNINERDVKRELEVFQIMDCLVDRKNKWRISDELLTDLNITGFAKRLMNTYQEKHLI